MASRSLLPVGMITSMNQIFRNAKLIEKRVPKHKFIQDSILELFNWVNFRAKREYQISYNRRYRSKARNGEIKTKAKGYIDIFANTRNFGVAFEYDNGALVKWKSIEKILQSNALYCFGIAYGPRGQNYAQNYRENLKRVQQVYKEVISDYRKFKYFGQPNFLLKKHFWLGIIQSGIFERVNISNNKIKNIL